MRGYLGCEIEHGVGDFLRLGIALVHGIIAGEHGHGLLVRHGIAKEILLDAEHHRRVDRAGADIVDMYADRAQLHGDALGETGDRVLGGNIGAVPCGRLIGRR